MRHGRTARPAVPAAGRQRSFARLLLTMAAAGAAWLLSAGASAASNSTTASAPAGRQPRVLVLQSYSHGFSWSDNVGSGIHSVFDERAHEVELCCEFMDVKRVYTPQYLEAYKSFLAAKYAGRRIDVMICCDDHALDFALGRGAELFPDVPIVFCAVNDYRPEAAPPGREITGVMETLDIRATLEVALRLHPGTREVVVITDRTRTGLALRRQAEAAFAPYGGRLEFRYLEHLTPARLKREVAALKPGTIVLPFIFSRDEAGRAFSHEKNLQLLASSCPVPIYSVWEFYLGHGIVGGKLTRGRMHGRAAARMAMAVLAGQPASEIPVLAGRTNTYMFDYRQLKRFNVAGSSLPPGSVVTHRPVSLYEEHAAWFWAAGGAIVVLSLAVVGLVGNIVRRRRAEQALRESERRYRSLVESAPVGLVVHRHWAIVYANDTAAEILGVADAETLVGRSLHDFIPPEARDRVADELARIQATSQPIPSTEDRIRREDGTVVSVAVSAAAVTFRGAPAVQTILLDITRRKALEEQLRHAQKMEAVGHLAGGVAHDFNNQLTVISGYCDLALGGGGLDAETRASLGEVRRAASRAKELTAKLLAFGRKQVLRPERLDLHEELLAMREPLTRMVGEDVEIALRSRPAEATAELDPGQFEQAVINAVINARDAMPEGGQVTISATAREGTVPGSAPQDRTPAGSHVEVTIADEGCGMDAETLDRVFEPFFTTKDVGKGTGLGLAMVYGFVTQSGGTVEIDSTPGEGTVVTMRFPAAGDEVTHQDRPPEEPAELERGNEAVLVVEDEPAVREYVVQALRRLGYEVRSTGVPTDAPGLARDGGREIDLLLTDVVMPRMGGVELAERLICEHPGLAVLFISGHANHRRDGRRRLPPDAPLLRKPFTVEALAAAVRRALAGRADSVS